MSRCVIERRRKQHYRQTEEHEKLTDIIRKHCDQKFVQAGNDGGTSSVVVYSNFSLPAPEHPDFNLFSKQSEKTQVWINKAKAIHGDTYSYCMVDYQGWS